MFMCDINKYMIILQHSEQQIKKCSFSKLEIAKKKKKKFHHSEYNFSPNTAT